MWGSTRAQSLWKSRPLIGRGGKQLRQERMHSKHGRTQYDAAVAVLDIGTMNDRVKQQTKRVYEYVALLAFNFLARIITMRVDPGPP